MPGRVCWRSTGAISVAERRDGGAVAYNPVVWKLSVLDQAPIISGSTPVEALRTTLRLAEAIDALGYHRYWVAEHHSSGALACSAPEILIGQILARTRHLRVGSGGVLLQHYSALKVAEVFRTLETLYPGRVDLGIGRAPGSDPRTAKALAAGPGSWPLEYFPQRVADLRRWLHDALEPDHPFAGVRAMPTGPSAPELWLLGSSAESAAYAALYGVPFAFAHFINQRDAVAVVRAYREAFRPSVYQSEPRALLAVFAVCAETEAEARRLARSRELFLVRLHQNARLPYPSLADVEAHVYTPQERAILAHTAGRTIAGTPEQVRATLMELAEAAGADELMVLTITPDFATRLRSYELLAEAFGLRPAAAPAVAAR